jgi:hypothetical protein
MRHALEPATDPGIVYWDDTATLAMTSETAAQEALLLMQPGEIEQPSGQANPQQQAQPAGGSMLPLLRLHLACGLDATLLPSVAACCRQLTSLTLYCFNLHAQDMFKGHSARDLSCLSSLHNLRELEIRCDINEWAVEQLNPLSSLTLLTKLHVPSIERASVRHLPSSLRCMELSDMFVGSLPDLQQMVSLTRLQTKGVEDPQLLPVQLQKLHVGDFEWSDAFLQLQQLQSLQIDVHGSEVPDLAPLAAWTHLTALRLCTQRLDKEEQPRVLSAMFQQLPKLPLVLLKLFSDSVTAADIEHVGQCTQLTALDFTFVSVGLDLGAFVEQLKKLQGLECLSLYDVQYSPQPQEMSGFQPLVDAVTQLCEKQLSESSLVKVVQQLEKQLDCAERMRRWNEQMLLHAQREGVSTDPSKTSASEEGSDNDLDDDMGGQSGNGGDVDGSDVDGSDVDGSDGDESDGDGSDVDGSDVDGGQVANSEDGADGSGGGADGDI